MTSRRYLRFLPLLALVMLATGVFGAAAPAHGQQPTNLGTFTIGQAMSFTVTASWTGNAAATIQVMETPPGRTLYNGPVTSTPVGSTGYQASQHISATAVGPTGQHTILATLRNAQGQTVASATGIITVNDATQPPPTTVQVACTPNPATTGQTVTCQAAAAPSGFNVVSTQWNYGDNTPATAASQHVYNAAGVYTVTFSRSLCTSPGTVGGQPTCYTQTGQTQVQVQAASSPVSIFSGSVTVNGVRAREGAVVQASVGVVVCGQTAVVGGNYLIEVLPVTARAGCGTNGALVRFTVDGVAANQNGTFDNTQAQRLDLTSGQPPTPTPSPIPSPSPSPSPTPSPTPSPSPTASPSPTPSPTAAPTASPTAAPTASPSPTPARTPIPQDVQQRAAAQLQTAEYVSGPRTLTVGQTTRIRLVYTITNPLNEEIDYSNTFVAELGPQAAIVSVQATSGANASSGRNAIVGGFVLAPGATNTITILTDVTPTAALLGGPVVIVQGGRTTGTTGSGLAINVPLQPVDSNRIGGLQGGLVIAAPTGPVTQPVPAAAAPVQGGPLPRTGTGADNRSDSVALLIAIAATAAAGVTLPVLLIRRRRAR